MSLYTAKRYSKNYECVIMKLKKVRLCQPEMHQKRLAVGFRPDPLAGGSYSAPWAP